MSILDALEACDRCTEEEDTMTAVWTLSKIADNPENLRELGERGARKIHIDLWLIIQP